MPFIQYQREVREVSKSFYWDNLDSLCILNGDEGQKSTKLNLYFKLRIDVFNLAGVFLHILADALGSVVVIISALVIWLTDWQYKYVKSKNNKHSVNFLNGRLQKFIDYFPGRGEPPIKDWSTCEPNLTLQGSWFFPSQLLYNKQKIIISLFYRDYLDPVLSVVIVILICISSWPLLRDSTLGNIRDSWL